VSNTNKIKNLELSNYCRLKEIQLMIKLFPQIEYLTTGMHKIKIKEMIRFLLSETNNKTRHLFFLRISEIPKRCLRELNVFIKLEK
jgi:hypothetical protein